MSEVLDLAECDQCGYVFTFMGDEVYCPYCQEGKPKSKEFLVVSMEEIGRAIGIGRRDYAGTSSFWDSLDLIGIDYINFHNEVENDIQDE